MKAQKILDKLFTVVSIMMFAIVEIMLLSLVLHFICGVITYSQSASVIRLTIPLLLVTMVLYSIFVFKELFKKDNA
ncbi:MAG: hypothetical protein WHV28_08915 [Bacteroidota bacterium]